MEESLPPREKKNRWRVCGIGEQRSLITHGIQDDQTLGCYSPRSLRIARISSSGTYPRRLRDTDPPGRGDVDGQEALAEATAISVQRRCTTRHRTVNCDPTVLQIANAYTR